MFVDQQYNVRQYFGFLTTRCMDSAHTRAACTFVVAILAPSRFSSLSNDKVGTPMRAANLQYASDNDETCHPLVHRIVVTGVHVRSSRRSKVVGVWRIA